MQMSRQAQSHKHMIHSWRNKFKIMKMKKSEVLPPQWMECVVAGAGVLTIILSNNVQLGSIAVLSTVFVLGWSVQEIIGVREIDVMANSSFRPNSSTGLLLGNLLIPMVTTSTLLWTDPTSSPLLNNDYLATVVLPCVLTPVAVLLCAMWKLKLTTDYHFVHQLVIIPVFVLLVWSFWLKHKVTSLLVLAVTGPISAYFFLTRLLYFLPKSFTLGEAVLVSESLTLVTVLAASSLTAGVGKLLACLQVLVLGCVIISVAVSPVATNLQTNSCHRPLLKDQLSKDPADKRKAQEAESSYLKLSLYFYICLAAAICLILLPWLGFLLGREPLMWGIFFATTTKTRMLLLCLWAVQVLGAVGVVTLWGSSSTVTRKYFHLLAIGIYVPGILHDVHLLYLASAGTLFIFIMLELLRIFRVWPVGDVLHDAFEVFLDEQDCGMAILTHIYLLLGMSLPVWVYMETPGDGQSGTSLALYSGVLSLGVGDTAASVVGSLYGKLRWPGSKKTVEGTCAAIVSQLLACYLLFHLDPHLTIPHGWAAIILVVSLTSVLEAVTTQIDNLVLPLFMYSLLISL